MTTMPFPQETPCLRAAFELYRLWHAQSVDFSKQGKQDKAAICSALASRALEPVNACLGQQAKLAGVEFPPHP